MLRIAVPNKGSLADASAEILKEAGYRQRVDARDLVLIDPENNVEFYYLRPRDIAIYVGSGELEAGITGRDLLIDSGAAAEEILSLGFGVSTFRFEDTFRGIKLTPQEPSDNTSATLSQENIENGVSTKQQITFIERKTQDQMLVEMVRQQTALIIQKIETMTRLLNKWVK
jgi:hypothetical protein